MIVDQVLDVRAYGESDVVAAPAMIKGDRDLITGSIRRGDKMVVLLAPHSLFGAADRLKVGAGNG